MQTTTSNKLTLIVAIIALFQGLIPAMPLQNANVAPILSAVLMFLASGLTAWKQYGSDEIKNNSTNYTWILLALAIVGGLNDLFSVVKFSELANQWIRFGITATTAILNFFSKMWFPTVETKSKF